MGQMERDRVPSRIRKFTSIIHEILIVYTTIIVIIIITSLVTHRPFLPGTSLEPPPTPTTQASVSDRSTFCTMCDVPCTAVFCSESIECFPGMASKFFFKTFVAIPVAPVITGKITHFSFHIRFYIIVIIIIIFM